jgi:arginine decarboxylase
MDHDRAPVLDAITTFHDLHKITFALPGHRLGAGIDDGTSTVIHRDAFGADVITAKSVAPEAEQLLADAVGALNATFTTCGSTVSMHTAVLTLVGPGDTVLVDRNVHKSVVAALIIAGAEPVWLRPRWDHQGQIAHPATAGDVGEALKRTPQARAVIMITPTEYGTGADVHGIADECHLAGVPLLVDEAWGAHFPFHPDLPTSAIRAGADLAVQSLHKAGGGFCQSSVILRGSDRVDPVDLRLRLDLMTTTSPSALMFGAIDGWRRHMVRHGKDLLGAALVRAGRLRNRLSGVDGLEIMDGSIIGHDGVAEWDPLKLCVDVSGLGISGTRRRTGWTPSAA